MPNLSQRIHNPTHQSESVTQICLFRWAKYMEGRYPELKWMYHVPNEGKRSKSAGARMRQEGLKAGVPDVCLPVPRGEYHGLYIEMKVGKNKPTDKQKEWLAGLKEQGYSTAVCYGWESASKLILKYLEGEIK